MTASLQAPPTLVAMKTDEGIRVYSPVDPNNISLVTGTTRVPNCTCLDFQQNVRIDPHYHCQHIEAVIGQLPQPQPGEGPTFEEERAAMQSEGRLPAGSSASTVSTLSMMTFKRSVSTDGRIDSLSVEFTLPVPGMLGDIKVKAFKTLALQDELVEAFRREHAPSQPDPQTAPNGQSTYGNGQPAGYGGGQPASGYGNGNGYPPQNGAGYAPSGPGPDGSVPATLADISGMQTRNGWSFFINVNAGGQMIRFFGKNNELSQAITAAGFPHLSGNIRQGAQLNLPCRVVLAQNGRYRKVQQFLPAGGNLAPQQAGYAAPQGGYRQ